jgi:serine protease Do
MHLKQTPETLALLALMTLAPLGSTSGVAAEKYWHDRSQAPGEMGKELPSLAPLVKAVRPAVVNISTTQHVRQPRNAEFFEQFFGQVPRDAERHSLGSGFIIHEQGYVLTNNHVIEGADTIKVKMGDGREFPARVVGVDPKTDVALVKIEAKTAFPFVYLGDSDRLEVGDWVLAIGNPFGLEASVTHGIVSAKERAIGAGPYDDFIQSDALINPGNSGGPLFNLAGEVVGINAAINPNGQGIGFAVPINLAKQLLPQLEEGKAIVRGFLGVGLQPLNQDLAQSLGLPSTEGALIASVSPNGPAAKGGLKQGDVVVAFNGKKVANMNELTRAVGSMAPGTKVAMDVIRDGKAKALSMRVGARPTDEQLGMGQRRGVPGGGEQAQPTSLDALGLAVVALAPGQAQALGIAPGDGVLVAEVAGDGAAADVGIQQGDIVLEIDRKAVHSVSDYEQAMKAVKNGSMVLLRLQRQQASIYVAVKARAA